MKAVEAFGENVEVWGSRVANLRSADDIDLIGDNEEFRDLTTHNNDAKCKLGYENNKREKEMKKELRLITRNKQKRANPRNVAAGKTNKQVDRFKYFGKNRNERCEMKE